MLHLLNVSTVADFLKFDPRQVFSIQGYGSTTYAALDKKRAWMERLNSNCENDADDDHPFLDAGIVSLGLSRRGEATLCELKVRTLRDFLSLDLSRVGRRLPGCGKMTQQELIAIQTQFRGQLIPDACVVRLEPEETARNIAEQPASQNSWKQLPLFCDRPIPGLAAIDLHPSYHPGCSVERLAFSRRVRRALTERRIASLGELLLTPGGALTETKGFSRYTLNQVRADIHEYLTHSLSSPLRTDVNWDTLDGFLLSLLQPIITNERERRVLLERMGWQSQPRTLEDIGQDFSLSRERIRQIEKKGLHKLLHWRSVAMLQPLHDVICTMLKDFSPLMSLKAMCRQLQRQFAWSRPPHEKALAVLLSAFHDLKCTDDRYVCVANMPCVDCPLLPMTLEAILISRRPKRISLSTVAPLLFEQISKCQTCMGRPERTSAGLARLAFSRSVVALHQFQLIDHDGGATDAADLLSDDAMLIVREAATPLCDRS